MAAGAMVQIANLGLVSTCAVCWAQRPRNRSRVTCGTYPAGGQGIAGRPRKRSSQRRSLREIATDSEDSDDEQVGLHACTDARLLVLVDVWRVLWLSNDQ